MQSNFVFKAGKSSITVYDLFAMSNKTIFAINDCGYDYHPKLYFNESREELYLGYNSKICVYLYKSMFKSLASNSALVVGHWSMY